jgi:hypothetical protein
MLEKFNAKLNAAGLPPFKIHGIVSAIERKPDVHVHSVMYCD